MGKHWDIITPRKKPQPIVADAGFIEFKNEVQTCLHKQCLNCHGTGVGEGGGACVHMLSCPCTNCSVSMKVTESLKKPFYDGPMCFVDARGTPVK